MNNVIHLETYCLPSELDSAIPALFELPSVPTSDSQIHRATETIKRVCETEGVPWPLHFKARYSPLEGTLIIYQVLPNKTNSLPIFGLRGIGRK